VRLRAGARLGRYVIERAVDAGAMGEVYCATDTRLDRRVAIKVLPRETAGDPVRRARFAREARALSGLSHPHICPIYDLGEHAGLPFFVMEHLDGETLAQRLARGPLAVADAVRVATEMAGALDHAHRRGIVHRDLKPANVILTADGAKLLDFGLARAAAPIGRGGAPHRPSRLATESLTEDGAILGTTQYMSPEQLEGMETDGRADIFALGAILFEMITSRPPFEADSKAGVIAAILERTPPAMAARRSPDPADAVPPQLERIVARCLARRPDDRWQTANDLKEALTWFTSGLAETAENTNRQWSRWPGPWYARWTMAVLLVLAFAVTVSAIWRRTPAARETWFALTAPEDGTFDPSSAFLTVSPDGNHLAFVASSREGGSALWIRPRNAVVARQLPDTAGAYQPFWSHDSRFIAFGVGRELKRIEVSTGIVQKLSDTVVAAGAWNRDGVIVLAPGPNERRLGAMGLYRVPLAGGTPTPLTVPDVARAETSHGWPHFLPDGRRFLYLARSNDPAHDGTVAVGSLDSSRRVDLFESDSHVVYASGHLVFMQGRRLVAQPFDVDTLRRKGEPVTIATDVERNARSRRGAFAVSERGVLAYRRMGLTQMVWIDRRGDVLGSLGEPAHYSNPALSPDGERLAVERADPRVGQSDVWIFEVHSGLASRFTHTGAERPLWYPRPDRIVVRAGANGGRARTSAFILRVTAGDDEDDILLSDLSPFDSPVSWSSGGRELIYSKLDPRSAPALWMLPLSGDRKSVPVARPPYGEVHGQVSPDGRWLAYVSNETGRYQVYVRPFPSGEGKWPISSGGGIEPVWRADGRELFYLAGDGYLMSVPVNSADGFRALEPTRLFRTAMSSIMNAAYTRNQYVASADGQRFLVIQPAETPPAVTVIIDWTARLTGSR
jgi:eukaryotic-like serine/threonine-protein kinase